MRPGRPRNRQRRDRILLRIRPAGSRRPPGPRGPDGRITAARALRHDPPGGARRARPGPRSRRPVDRRGTFPALHRQAWRGSCRAGSSPGRPTSVCSWWTSSHQQAGIGTALLKAAEAATRTVANHLVLLVTTDNARARRFYEQHGYRHVGCLPGLARATLDEALYWKTLRTHGERLPV